MGVDFYTCAHCGYNFPDCGDFFGCECGEHFCDSKCGDRKVDEENEDISTCRLCRKDSATDNNLLHALLAHFNITYDQAMEIYRKQEE
jgi:hypothetical protein